MRLSLVVWSTCLASACTADGTEVARDIVTDSSGIAIVTASAVDHPLDWTFTPVVELGGADRGPASFTAATHTTVATNDRDRIYVFDRDASAVQAFSDDGTPVSTMGGKGSGPGEISFAFGLVDAGPGVVAVYDYSKRALLRWDDTGAVLDEALVPAISGGGSIVAIRGDTSFVMTRDADSTRTVASLERITPTGTKRLATLETPPRAMVQFSCFAAPVPPLFTPDLTWATHGAWLAVARQDRYQVDVFRDGKLVRSLRRAIEGAPTTALDVIREMPDGMRVEFGGGSGCTIPSEEVAEKRGMADRLPVIKWMAFGPDGTLWVQRHTFPGASPGVDVFAIDGGYLGTDVGRGLPLGELAAGRVLFPVADSSTGVTQVGIYTTQRAANP